MQEGEEENISNYNSGDSIMVAPTDNASLKKKAKTWGEMDKVVSLPMSVLKPKAVVPYSIDVHNSYSVAWYTEGNIDCIEVKFHVNGVLPPVGVGWKLARKENGMSVHWQRSIHKLCFTKEHLKAIMGHEYADTHTRVVAYDNSV